MNRASRNRRHTRIRSRIQGTAERPRASVHRSLTRISVQLIDDAGSRTLLSASGKPQEVGKSVAEAALGLGIKKIVFDRGGYKYHGRVKTVAESMRQAGLDF